MLLLNLKAEGDFILNKSSKLCLLPQEQHL